MSEIRHKDIEVELKADGEAGQFTALASVFGNVDKVGDRMMPGAFTRTLKDWRASGRKLPIIWSHQWDQIDAHVGYANPEDLKQTKQGLEVKAHLDIDVNDTARALYRLMKRGQISGMSFGYTVPEGGENMADDGANEISEVQLHEVGPTLVGANSEAQVQLVKSAMVEGERLDEKAVWSAAFINDLPDSSFLYIEPGGEKDDQGKTTPRSLRHFPVKGPDGTVDLPHLRNALARIPQSNLPQSVKDRITATAERMLAAANNTSSVEADEAEAKAPEVEDGEHEEPDRAKEQSEELEKAKGRPQDPLRDEIDRVRLEIALGRTL